MSLMDTLRDKAKEHNDKVGDVASKRTSASTLKKVYDRGIGAYRTNPQSVRPNVTSASQWAFGRVNSFLYVLRNGKFRGGKHDTDLLPKGHPMASSKQSRKEPQLSYFRTQEEAEEYAEFLGCTGTHTHTLDGESYYMACSSHERNLELEDMRQGKKSYQYKGFDAEVRDVDLKTRTVTGYFAQFGMVDSDGDSIMKNAFMKSIQENGPDSAKPRIMHLYQHDTKMPLGRPKVLVEDEYGLYFESDIVDTTYGTDVLKLYEAGVINEHSIGFQTVRATPKDGYNQIDEVRLFEGSTVTFGANENTPFTGFKNMTPDKAIERVKNMTSAVRSGTFTDDTFHLLEIQLKQLEQFIIDQLIPQDEDSPVESTKSEVLPEQVDAVFEAFALKLFNPKI